MPGGYILLPQVRIPEADKLTEVGMFPLWFLELHLNSVQYDSAVPLANNSSWAIYSDTFPFCPPRDSLHQANQGPASFLRGI